MELCRNSGSVLPGGAGANAARSARRALLVIGVAIVFQGSCSGPVPLAQAIWPQHDQEFRTLLAADPEDPGAAWIAWQARRQGISVEQARANDAAISSRRNPFRAKDDPAAVSRGAVLYRAYCQRCHGESARGDGPDHLPDHRPRDLRGLGQRFAVTLHGGAPRTWFRKISEGYGETAPYPDGPTTAMPAFGDKLAREQIWLVITYLQSLDVYSRPGHQESTP